MAVITRSYNVEFCRGTVSDNQDRAGTGTAYELAAMLIYVCDEQVSFGQIMFSPPPPPTKFFPYADAQNNRQISRFLKIFIQNLKGSIWIVDHASEIG